MHVVRISDRRDVSFGLGEGIPVAADITQAGLFYASNRKPLWGESKEVESYRGNPSRVVFVPMREVLARLGR